MGGLYNVIMGRNPFSAAILATLGLVPADFARFRDCFVAEGEIAVYTRLGGGNRPDYAEVWEKMRAHPCYLRDKDDSFDSTYATIYFKFPDEFAEGLRKLDSGEKFDPDKRWQDAIAALKAS